MDLMHTAHVPQGRGPHPTIIAVHGYGASAHDLFGLAPILHGGECLVLCPQAPIPVEMGPGMPPGWSWFPITGGGPIDRAAVVVALAQLRGFVDDACARYPIDRERVTLMGFSQGGVLAYDLALREPERFAGLVALSSWLPADLMNRIPQTDAQKKLPALVVHGTKDPMIPVTRAHESRDRLKQLGLDPAYHEFDMQHEINPDALRTVMGWLVERL